MKNEIKGILLDTNAARNFSNGINYKDIDSYAKDMARKFDSHGLYMMISPIVTMELLSHLSSKGDHDYHKCFNSIKAMFLTEGYQKITNHKRLTILPADCLVARDLFTKEVIGKEVHLKEREEMYESFINRALEISQLNDAKDVKGMDIGEGKTLMDYVTKIEQEYANLIKGIALYYKLDVNNIDEMINTDNIKNELAHIVIHIIYVHLIKQGDVPDIFKKLKENHSTEKLRWENILKHQAEMLRIKYPYYISLAQTVLKKTVQKMSDNKLHNFWWDSQLMFHANDQILWPNGVTLVTNDNAMLNSIKTQKAFKFIMKYEDFVSEYNLHN